MHESYGLTLRAPNARRALIDVARAVMERGEEASPRGMLTRELRHLTFVIDDPGDASCAGIGANFSGPVAALEATQLVGGFSDPDLVRRVAPSMMQFARRGAAFDGAYGPRVRRSVRAAVRRLRQDPDTRQAVVNIWDESDALREESLDYPCTLSLHFLVRRGRLDLDVTMRSNDVDWGMKHDVFQFTQLQLAVARCLGVEPGAYCHTANSMHLYARSFEWADRLDDSRAEDPGAAYTPPGYWSEPGQPESFQHRARLLAAGSLDFLRDGERWYVDNLHGDRS